MAHIKICKEPDCHNAATTSGYCRLHYLRNWKRIRDEGRRRSAKKLNRYIEHVMKNHPERYVEVIKKNLREPGFDRYVEENFGSDEGDEVEVELFDDPAYEEEIDRLIKQLKVEKGF